MRARRVAAPLALAALCVLAAACAPVAPRPEAPPPPAVGDDIRLPVSDPQVLALWQDAELARQTRDYTRAGIRLEQALSMAPQNPALWSRLAEVRLLQEQSANAENLAAKSNVLAAGNAPLQYRNWLIIAHAREMRGDADGAELARRQAQRLEDQRSGAAGDGGSGAGE